MVLPPCNLTRMQDTQDMAHVQSTGATCTSHPTSHLCHKPLIGDLHVEKLSPKGLLYLLLIEGYLDQ